MGRTKQRIATSFVVCVENGGYDLDLHPLKLYQVVPDNNIESDDIRVIDETGEDYIYPAEYFVPVELSETDEVDVKRILSRREAERS